MRSWLVAAVAASVVCVAPAARAQSSTFEERSTAAGQDIRFYDDPLTALTDSPIGAQLTTFRPARRFELMHPRTTFVPQMLSSVERL